MQTTFRFLRREFSPEQGSASFFYQLHTPEKTYDFVETLHFPKVELPNAKNSTLNTILDNLLLILGISYWKTTCGKIELPENIVLNKEQAEFWNTIYTKGLGEFYYKNKIDFRGLVNFPYSQSPVILSESEESHSKDDETIIDRDTSASSQHDNNNNEAIQQFHNRSLLFFGGGKDSIVSAELLKRANKPFTLFMVNSSPIQEQTAEVVGAESIVIKRTIDPTLIELNKQPGIYNGHIPISAAWAFVGLFAAQLYGYDYLITSNEQSANYGNVEYLGTEVNHQWSKSEEFEHLFTNYVQENITSEISYFSFLRSLHEIKIAEIFSKYEQYFPYFSSCNRNFTIKKTKQGKESQLPPLLLGEGGGEVLFKRPNSNLLLQGEGILNPDFIETSKRPWCGECPKCLFVFIILSAFLPKEKLLTIFGKNLYQDEKLLPLLKELAGLENFKPFECVGTPEETLFALFLASKTGSYEQDFLMKFAKTDILPIIKNPDILSKTLLAANSITFLPSYFLDALSL